MSFKKRRELLFVYSVRDANPNGDPLVGNHPRYDEKSEQVLVSGDRIKRTIRDQLMREGYPVFIDGEPKTLRSRAQEIKELFNAEAIDKDLLRKCIDIRLFGTLYALKADKQENDIGTFAWEGPVQWLWGRSLHKADVKEVMGTAAFANEDSKEQRSFRHEYIVHFALIACYGVANQYSAEKTHATAEDLDIHYDAVWTGHENLLTKSKMGHKPRFLLEVTYKEGYKGLIGLMDEQIMLKKYDGNLLTDEEQLALRSLNEVILDINPLAGAIIDRADYIDRIRIRKDKALKLQGLEKIQKHEQIGVCLELEER